MEIVINNQTGEKKWNRYKKDFETIAKRTEEVLGLEKKFETSVIFVSATQIHEINRDYRSIDRPTDVISFAMKDSEDDYEMMEGQDELGDIFINIEAIVSQASDYGHTIRREVCFLFTHGLLHLLGYDHNEEDEEKAMFSQQDVILDAIVPKKISK